VEWQLHGAPRGGRELGSVIDWCTCRLIKALPWRKGRGLRNDGQARRPYLRHRTRSREGGTPAKINPSG